jgi:hypothetical protein
MYKTNSIIRKYLESNDFHDFYFFPHLRFQKDYQLNGCGFDALGFKDKQLYLFQFKTNKHCPKKELERYKELSKKYNCIPCWVSYFGRKNKKYKGVIIWNGKTN